jgi:hypothetical protein
MFKSNADYMPTQITVKQVHVLTRMRSSAGRFMRTRPRSNRGKRQHCLAHFTAPKERYTDEPVSARIRKCLLRSVSSLDDVRMPTQSLKVQFTSRCMCSLECVPRQADSCAHALVLIAGNASIASPTSLPPRNGRCMRRCCLIIATRSHRTCPRGGDCPFYREQVDRYILLLFLSPYQTTCRRSLCWR